MPDKPASTSAERLPFPKTAWRVVLPGIDIYTSLGQVVSEYGDLLLVHPELGLVLWQPLENHELAAAD